MLRVLIDADNVAARRLAPVLALLTEVLDEVRTTASGRPGALAGLDWGPETELIATAGWQRADAALAAAYVPTVDPLLLASGDGDFALMATRHPGAVLVVSGAPSRRLRDATTVVDPALEGVEPIRLWLRSNGVRLQRAAGRRPPM